MFETVPSKGQNCNFIHTAFMGKGGKGIIGWLVGF
jgi:hypothetical protein